MRRTTAPAGSCPTRKRRIWRRSGWLPSQPNKAHQVVDERHRQPVGLVARAIRRIAVEITYMRAIGRPALQSGEAPYQSKYTPALP